MRIGTRASALALAQAESVAGLLGGGEIVPMVTSGDRGEASEDKSRWVAELESALRSGQLDLAVHSAKDLPGELAEGLVLASSPVRMGAEDVLCGAPSIEALAAGARVGTSSIRRRSQLAAAREDLDVVSMRGNVDTRLRKLAAGELDALVLARAGLQRLRREDSIGAVLDAARFVPAPGQGVLALQARADDASTLRALAAICDAKTFTCLRAERALAGALQASCHTPLGAHAVPCVGGLRLRAWVGLPDGSAWIADALTRTAADPEALGREVAERMRLAGAYEILAAAERTATPAA